MVIIAIYGWSKGNPDKYLSGVDDDGKFCGYSDGYEKFDRLYFPDLSSVNNVKTKYICIKGGCPSATSPSTLACKPTNEVPDCNAGFTRYNTKSYLGKYCLPVKDDLPASLKDNYDTVWDWLQIDTLTEYVSDVAKAWPILLIGMFITLILCLIFMILVEYFAAILAWVSIILSFAALVGLGLYFFFTRNKTSDQSDNNQNKYNIVWACFCWAGAGAIFFFVCCYCKALRIAIGVIQAAADFMTDTKRIMLVPLGAFCILAIFYALWVCVAIYVYTIGDIESSGGQGKRVHWDDTTKRAWYYHFFGLFWINAMFDACVSFIIIVSAATWYFSHGSDQEGSSEVYKGFKWIWRYHCGSLALGSLIIAIVQVIRVMFEYFRKKVQAANPQNAALHFLLCMVSYAIACLNRFIKFINRNAYIQVALTS